MQTTAHGSYRRKLLSGLLFVASVIVLAVVMLLAPKHPATTVCACTPPPGGLPHHTVAERTNAAGVVLDGEVIHVEGDWLLTATVEVNRYFKGRGPEVVTISNLGPGSLCLSWVSVGDKWVFYTTGNPDAVLSAHYLSQFDAIDPVTPAVVTEVIAAAGHDPVPPYSHRVYVPVLRTVE